LDSLLFLSPEVWFDDQTVHSKVDHERPHSGIEYSAGKKLVRQMNREEVGLTGPVEPGEKHKDKALKMNQGSSDWL
jgi:hypothetical protein